MGKILEGETAIITGGGSGIGQGTAVRFATEGANVLVVDKDPNGARKTAELGGGQSGDIELLVQDVTAQDAPTKIFDTCGARLGEPTVFINNAGIGASRPVHETDDENLDRFLDVNFRSGFRLTREFVNRRLQIAQPGVVVHLASVFGMRGFPTSSAYSATKAALIGLTRNMAADYGPHGIRINAISPGVIRTPINSKRLDDDTWFRDTLLNATPLGRFGEPADIAAAILFLCSKDASFITGQVLAVDGGWSSTKFSPAP
tara:strand:- start:964 stop:1743 length:780 start_codon:yes stop_codon:yes gene_type:complete